MSDLFLAGDLGGTKMAAALVDENGQIEYQETRPTLAADGMDAVAGRFARLLDEVASRPSSRPPACGIAAPGLVDPSSGEILYAANLPGARRYPLRKRLEAGLHLPVSLDNDLRLHALGESTFGAAAGCSDFLFVGVGTGVGGALFLNGKLHRGSRGSAGEIGHIQLEVGPAAPACGCGRRGCLETFASGPAIAADFLQAAEEAGLALETPSPDLVEISRWIDQPGLRGDLARAAIAAGAQALGRGLSIALTLVDPERIILGGGVSRIGPAWLAPVRRAAAEHALNPFDESAIQLARLSSNAALVGAAILAHQAFGDVRFQPV
jgi:glucokinase